MTLFIVLHDAKEQNNNDNSTFLYWKLKYNRSIQKRCFPNETQANKFCSNLNDFDALWNIFINSNKLKTKLKSFYV